MGTNTLLTMAIFVEEVISQNLYQCSYVTTKIALVHSHNPILLVIESIKWFLSTPILNRMQGLFNMARDRIKPITLITTYSLVT
jgi:hypothetical protein